MEPSNSTERPAIPVRYSETFNDPTAEITFESSDGVRFRIHAVYLKAHTEVMAPPKGSTFTEVAKLTDSAATLELLFKFIYPIRQPMLETEVDFLSLMSLAEAAEKYLVFPAIYACFLQLKSLLPSHALSILAFALKHQHIDLVDAAAPHVLDCPTADVIDHIPIDSYKAWFSYYDKWVNVQTRALTTHLEHYGPAQSDISALAGKLTAVREASSRIHYEVGPGGYVLADSWWTAIDFDVNGIPKLSTFISGRADPNPTSSAIVQEDEQVIIEASDKTHHSMDLEVLRACTKGFDDPHDGRIQVTENSSTLALLLQFIQPVQSPDLDELSFNSMKDLAYAAEKYSIQQAISVCRIFMRAQIPGHPTDVFYYAAKHNHLDILDSIAPSMISSRSFQQIMIALPDGLKVPWARYYQKWQDAAMNVIREAIDSASTQPQYRRYCCCTAETFMFRHLKECIKELSKDPGSLKSVYTLFPLCSNSSCAREKAVFDKCREYVNNVVKEISALSSFLV